MTSDPDVLRGADGIFAMVALDHRRTLEAFLEERATRPIGDDDLTAFKAATVEVLASEASAFLVDLDYGMPAVESTPPPHPVLIVAALVPDRRNGTTAGSTLLDPRITPVLVERTRTAALKLFVTWEPDQGAQERADLVGRFLDLAHRCGTVGLVEGVTRLRAHGTADDRDAAVLACARELGALGPDVYKAEAPGIRDDGDLSRVTAWSRELTAALDCPWVVLSQGVPPDRFGEVVERACAGGASGFLAGQAVWSEVARAVGSSVADAGEQLRQRAVPRFRELRACAARGIRARTAG